MTTESDIVERLRQCDENFELVQEAADEIARLRTRNEAMSADNERLRAALERLVAYLVPGIISR